MEVVEQKKVRRVVTLTEGLVNQISHQAVIANREFSAELRVMLTEAIDARKPEPLAERVITYRKKKE